MTAASLYRMSACSSEGQCNQAAGVGLCGEREREGGGGGGS